MGERANQAFPHPSPLPHAGEGEKRACPANCIFIEAAENTEEERISSSERYAKVYNIDYNRCIFCGYCVEACPTDAITHGHGFELATLNATNLVMRKEDMLVPLSALTAAK